MVPRLLWPLATSLCEISQTCYHVRLCDAAEVDCFGCVRVCMEVMKTTTSSVRIRFRIKSVKVSCIIPCYDHQYLTSFASKGFTVHECINHLGENRDTVLLAIYFLSSIEFYSWNLLEPCNLCAALESGEEDVRS